VEAHPHAPGARRKLSRIAEEVAHDLVDASGVGVDPEWPERKMALEKDLVLLEGDAVVVDHATNQRRQIEAQAPEPNLAARDAGDVEEVVDDVRQVAHLSIDDGERLVC